MAVSIVYQTVPKLQCQQFTNVLQSGSENSLLKLLQNGSVSSLPNCHKVAVSVVHQPVAKWQGQL